MPTYDYTCQKCGHAFERQQSMKDAALTTCPKDVCPKKTWGKGKVKRGIGTGAGIIFKGSGFYITDYRSEGYKTAAKKDSEAAAPKTETKSETKSDSKPAAPTATPAPAKTPPAKKKA
jgi:putative FmdB family regulatory protein